MPQFIILLLPVSFKNIFTRNCWIIFRAKRMNPYKEILVVIIKGLLTVTANYDLSKQRKCDQNAYEIKSAN